MSDYNKFLEDVRNRVLDAFDKACEDNEVDYLVDGDLPDLFAAIDSVARDLWGEDNE